MVPIDHEIDERVAGIDGEDLDGADLEGMFFGQLVAIKPIQIAATDCDPVGSYVFHDVSATGSRDAGRTCTEAT
jgi:hypothetical protein